MKKLCMGFLIVSLLATATVMSDAAEVKAERNYFFCEAEDAVYEKGSIAEMPLDGAYGPEGKTLFFSYPGDSKWHDLGTGEDNPALKMTFQIPEDGTYYLWFRVFHMSGNDDSVYYSVDGGEQWERQSFYNLDYPVEWDDECGFMKLYWGKGVKLRGSDPFVGNPLSLKKGTVGLQIKFREVFAGASLYLDKVMLTDDPDYTPNKTAGDPENDIYPESGTDSTEPPQSIPNTGEAVTSAPTSSSRVTSPDETVTTIPASKGTEGNLPGDGAERKKSAILYILTALVGAAAGFVAGRATKKSKAVR